MIILDKNQKISLGQSFGNKSKIIRLGVGWYPSNYVPIRLRKDDNSKTDTVTKPQGFLGAVGNFITGKGRVGDVVNSAVDSGKNLVNKAVDYIDGEFDSNSLDAYADKLEEIDVDLSVAFYSKGRQVAKVFWHHDYQSAFNGAVKHSGDNRTGKPKRPEDMEKDKEYITIDTSKLPDEIDEFVHFVQIYEGRQKGQNFGNIGGGFARLSNDENKDSNGIPEELAFFNLSENYKGVEGIYLVRFYKYDNDWRMETLGTTVDYAPYVDDMLKQYKSINA